MQSFLQERKTTIPFPQLLSDFGARPVNEFNGIIFRGEAIGDLKCACWFGLSLLCFCSPRNILSILLPFQTVAVMNIRKVPARPTALQLEAESSSAPAINQSLKTRVSVATHKRADQGGIYAEKKFLFLLPLKLYRDLLYTIIMEYNACVHRKLSRQVGS